MAIFSVDMLVNGCLWGQWKKFSCNFPTRHPGLPLAQLKYLYWYKWYPVLFCCSGCYRHGWEKGKNTTNTQCGRRRLETMLEVVSKLKSNLQTCVPLWLRKVKKNWALYLHSLSMSTVRTPISAWEVGAWYGQQYPANRHCTHHATACATGCYKLASILAQSVTTSPAISEGSNLIYVYFQALFDRAAPQPDQGDTKVTLSRSQCIRVQIMTST